MPWCSTVRSSRIGRKISTPSIRMIEQGGERQGAGLDPRGAVDQRRRRAAGDRAVGDAARQRVGAQHPHGAAEEVARLDLELVGARLALAEGLQGRQPLDRIEELGGEGGIGSLPELRVADVELVPQRRARTAPPGEAQHHQRHRQVDEGHDGEDQHRREQGDQELRQELAEIGLELLDAVDHGERQRARALAADRARVRARRSGRRACAAAPSAPAPRSRAPPRRANARRRRAAPSPGRSAATAARARRACGRRRPGRSASPAGPAGRRPARRTTRPMATAPAIRPRTPLVKTRRRGSMCMAAMLEPNVNIRHSTIRKNRCTFLNMDRQLGRSPRFPDPGARGHADDGGQGAGRQPSHRGAPRAGAGAADRRAPVRAPARPLRADLGGRGAAGRHRGDGKSGAVDPSPQRRPQRHGERRRAPVGRRGDGAP